MPEMESREEAAGVEEKGPQKELIGSSTDPWEDAQTGSNKGNTSNGCTSSEEVGSEYYGEEDEDVSGEYTTDEEEIEEIVRDDEWPPDDDVIRDSRTREAADEADLQQRSEEFSCAVREVAGKQMGLVATTAIQRGELVLRERPIIDSGAQAFRFMERRGLGAPPFSAEEVALANALEARKGVAGRGAALQEIRFVQHYFTTELTRKEKKKVMRLHDCAQRKVGKKTAFGVFATNSLPRGSDSEASVLCLVSSRINHSCRPCVQCVWVDPYMRVVATRDIAKGEELCRSYCEVRAGAAMRQQKLDALYGFECMCEACMLPQAQKDLSDRARTCIRNLSKQVAAIDLEKIQPECHGHLEEIVEAVEAALGLMDEEGIGYPLLHLNLYSRAFQCAVALGLGQGEVRSWALKARNAALDAEGFHGPSTRRYAQYAHNPRCYHAWREKGPLERWMPPHVVAEVMRLLLLSDGADECNASVRRIRRR
eukprot:GHVU01126650.1.p1 GENE.GHVU01126650.1~~GHVU01126650.1.p1  ORF type:complete len:482 (-),score=79.58 GHVU01126650.1:798-2243(-)